MQDFRLRSTRRPRVAARRAPHKGKRPRGGRSGSPAKRTFFHAPSFSGGVVLGAVIVLGTAYLPELLSSDEPAGPPADTGAADNAERPELTFEFDDLLRNSKVTADPEPYRSEAAETTDTDETIVLQAASFRSEDDAERLRAALLLMDLPAATQTISLANGRWYRVTVGPFDRRVEAERAMTRLRERDISAMWTKRPAQ
ncbi:MAG: SPOR domain-containing protein [Pseudomonadota bacterium]